MREWCRPVEGAATQRAAPRLNRRCSTATQRGTKERGTPWWLAWHTRPRRRQVSRTRRLVCSQLRNCWRRSVGGAGRTQAWADAWRRLASGWRSLFALTGWLQMAARSRCAVTAQEALTRQSGAVCFRRLDRVSDVKRNRHVQTTLTTFVRIGCSGGNGAY